MKRHFNIYLLLAAFFAALLPSCSADDPAPGTDPVGPPASGSFTLSARPLASQAGTRAALDPSFGTPDNLRDEELIHSFYVIFLKKASQDATDGIVQEVVQGKLAANEEGKERQSFSPRKLIGEGLYDILAFANIGEDTIKNKIDQNLLTEGETVNVKALSEKAGGFGAYIPDFKVYESGNAKETDYMPMSGIRRNVSIKDNLESGSGLNKNSIEVIRMFAKVEIMVKNSTGADISIQSVTLSKLNNCEFKLFPNYGILGDKMTDSNITEFENYLAGDFITSGAMPVAISGDDGRPWKESMGAGSVEKAIFYSQDSSARLANPGFDHFMISVTIKREDGTQQTHYAPTDELKWIQRNDHIVIPVSLTDLTVDWQVVFYPPIGGYPAIVETDEDFNYRCTFGTQGEFSIRPIIRDGKGKPIDGATFRIINGSKETLTELTPSEMTITTAHDETQKETIFKKLPKRKGNEFVGELNSNEGTALFSLEIEVTYPDATAEGGKKTESRKRNIYITRKNPANP